MCALRPLSPVEVKVGTLLFRNCNFPCIVHMAGMVLILEILSERGKQLQLFDYKIRITIKSESKHGVVMVRCAIFALLPSWVLAILSIFNKAFALTQFS